MRSTAGLLAAALLTLSSTATRADRGSISFKRHVQIFEPRQRALIAWNGTEEILILSNDLRASEPTRVLEVLPLPAEPEVTKGDVEIFRRAVAIINQRQRAARHRGMKGKTVTPRPEPAGEVTFHKKIGAHDVSVTHVKDAQGFVDWVAVYTRVAGRGGSGDPGDWRLVASW